MTEAVIIKRAEHRDPRGAHIKFLGDNVTGKDIPDFVARESFMTFNNRNTLRGMHFQDPNPQQKLITPLTGAILVNVINITNTSERISKIIKGLDDEMVFVPAGWALGYRALEDATRVLYLADAPFDGACDNGIDPFDVDLAINWVSPLEVQFNEIVPTAEYVLSERDRNLLSYKEFLAQKGA